MPGPAPCTPGHCELTLATGWGGHAAHCWLFVHACALLRVLHRTTHTSQRRALHAHASLQCTAHTLHGAVCMHLTLHFILHDMQHHARDVYAGTHTFLCCLAHILQCVHCIPISCTAYNTAQPILLAAYTAGIHLTELHNSHLPVRGHCMHTPHCIAQCTLSIAHTACTPHCIAQLTLSNARTACTLCCAAQLTPPIVIVHKTHLIALLAPPTVSMQCTPRSVHCSMQTPSSVCTAHCKHACTSHHTNCSHRRATHYSTCTCVTVCMRPVCYTHCTHAPTWHLAHLHSIPAHLLCGCTVFALLWD